MWEEMCILELMNCGVYGNINKKLAQNSIITTQSYYLPSFLSIAFHIPKINIQCWDKSPVYICSFLNSVVP